MVVGEDTGPASGAAQYLARLVAGLRAEGVDVLRVLGRSQRTGVLPAQIDDCARAIASWRPQAMFIETASAFGHAALAAARAANLPAVAQWHAIGTGLPEPDRLALRDVLFAFHRHAAATLVETEPDLEALRAAGVPNVALVRRGVDTDAFTPAARRPALRASWGAGDDDPVLLSVGRLLALKNPELLIRTLDQVRAAVPRMRAVVVGDGPAGEALRLALPWAVFTGTLGQAELPAVYASADLFCFTSRVDTWGAVVVESLACGVPVVAFRRGAAHALSIDGVAGRALEDGDEDGFVSAALALASDLRATRAMAPAARAAAQPLTARATARVVRDLLARMAGVH